MLKSKKSMKTNSAPELEVEGGESCDRYEALKRRKKSTSSSSKYVERKCVICDRAKERVVAIETGCCVASQRLMEQHCS